MSIKKAAVILFLFVPFYLGAQTSPEEFLGHKVGADRKLADYNQIQAYFHKLDQESGKLRVLTIGETTLGKPMILAVMTSEKNMERLDAYRQIARRLSQARDLSPEEAKQLAREGKVIVLITCSLHADEIGSSQEALEFAHRLVTGKTPFDANRALDEVIVLLIPAANPDGQQMVIDWYRKNLGTKYEGGPMPWLYHHYAGHDNNRDFAFNLAETRAICKVLYHDWFPQIYDDKHQTWPYRIRCFVPPFVDPADPAIHPLVFSGINLIGANMAYDLQKKRHQGVAQARNYASAWYKGALTSVGMVHNIVTVFTEMASVKMATPIHIDSTEIHGGDPDQWGDLSTKSLTYLDPWPGGWWRLGNIVDYELNTSFSLVETAFLHKEDWLYNSYKMGRDAIEAGQKGDPFAFIIPEEQTDYPTTLRMLNILMFGGAEIHRAREGFVADGNPFPAGSFVVLASQPYRPLILAYLEERKYPNIHVAPKLRDNAGHELPLQMGISFSRIANPFEAKLDELESIPYPFITPPNPAPFIVLDSRVNASYPVVISLLGENAEVYRSKEAIKGSEFSAAAGSFIIRNTPQVQKLLPALLEKWHLKAHGFEAISDIPKALVKNPRVGIYQSWRDNMAEGWLRYVFDEFEIPFTTLHNEDFKATRAKKVDLKEKFDVIVFADENPEIIKTGRSSETSRRFEMYYGTLPPRYEGGIGVEGLDALKSFVEQGGVILALNNASSLFINEFKIPARNVLDGIPQSKFFCLKSLLKIKVDNTSPIGYGMPDQASAMFGGEYVSLAFNTWLPPIRDWEREIVASYPADNILLRGGLIGEDLLAHRAAVIDFKYKKGHIILVGLLCEHRAQTHGTYKFLFNSILYPVL